LEITGVGCVGWSVPLHAAKNKTQKTATSPAFSTRFFSPRRNGPKKREGNVFLAVILDRSSFIFCLWDRLAGHTVLTLNPAAKVNKLTAFRTEGTDRIVFPLDWLTAGWTLHES
jgi:hypothetical protein